MFGLYPGGFILVSDSEEPSSSIVLRCQISENIWRIDVTTLRKLIPETFLRNSERQLLLAINGSPLVDEWYWSMTCLPS
jgi:hypothetical protein